MLHRFLTQHRDELIGRCREKVAKRCKTKTVLAVSDHGVPLFLQQLADVLGHEKAMASRPDAEAAPSPSPTAIGRSAAMHGTELMHLAFTIDQVVHDYGDICQAVTDLAMELNEELSTDEFRTLNRCLDDAIAEAVTSFTHPRTRIDKGDAASMAERLAALSIEHRRLVDIAIQSFSAIKSGNVGLTGATGALHAFSLDELRTLVDRSFPDVPSSAANEVMPIKVN